MLDEIKSTLKDSTFDKGKLHQIMEMNREAVEIFRDELPLVSHAFDHMGHVLGGIKSVGLLPKFQNGLKKALGF